MVRIGFARVYMCNHHRCSADCNLGQAFTNNACTYGGTLLITPTETNGHSRGESGFFWRESSRAELHVYNLRHIQHHAAQLGLRFQLAGGAPLEWVSEG